MLITLLAKINLNQKFIKKKITKDISPEANEHQIKLRMRQEGLYLASQSAAHDEV